MRIACSSADMGETGDCSPGSLKHHATLIPTRLLPFTMNLGKAGVFAKGAWDLSPGAI
jgi:hypothetical protein